MTTLFHWIFAFYTLLAALVILPFDLDLAETYLNSAIKHLES